MWVELELGNAFTKKYIVTNNYFNKQTAFILHLNSSVSLTSCQRFIAFLSCLRPQEGVGVGNSIYLEWKFGSLFCGKVVKKLKII